MKTKSTKHIYWENVMFLISIIITIMLCLVYYYYKYPIGYTLPFSCFAMLCCWFRSRCRCDETYKLFPHGFYYKDKEEELK